LTEGLSAAGVAVDLNVEPLADLPTAVHSAGYRIVQEALTNIARHADARTTRVCVRQVPGAVTIEVADDGQGTRDPNGGASGNGLRGMRERAASLGGTLEAAQAGSGGWRVLARLPVAPPPHRRDP